MSAPGVSLPTGGNGSRPGRSLRSAIIGVFGAAATEPFYPPLRTNLLSIPSERYSPGLSRATHSARPGSWSAMRERLDSSPAWALAWTFQSRHRVASQSREVAGSWPPVATPLPSFATNERQFVGIVAGSRTSGPTQLGLHPARAPALLRGYIH